MNVANTFIIKVILDFDFSVAVQNATVISVRGS